MKLLLVAVLMVGCAEAEAPPQEEITLQTYEEELQGHNLLGAHPDALTPTGSSHYSVGKDAINRTDQQVSVSNGELVVKNKAGTKLYSGTNGSFWHLQLQSIDGSRLRIEAIAVDVNTGKAIYRLEYARPGSNNWGLYCDPNNFAVPMQGTWDASGYHEQGSNLSFGCIDDGTTAKCFGWGYIPDELPKTTGWDAHQACTRMARADICGNGQSHTRDLTPIVIRDFLPGYHPAPWDPTPLYFAAQQPAPPDLFFFESAWKAGKNGGAVCLSKQRWASLPLEGPCGTALKDPRVDSSARFCEDYHGDDDFIDNGAILVNASMTQDMYLHRWSNPDTGDVVATVRGYYSAFNPVIPFAGYTNHIDTDGIVLRNLPGSIGHDKVTEIYSVATTAPSGTVDRLTMPVMGLVRTDPRFEGYYLNDGIESDGERRVPFGRYARSDEDGNVIDLLTDSAPEDTDFVLTQSLGWVFMPAAY